MFKIEPDFSELIHKEPEIILSGIPEINPDLCPGDTPGILLSLGREIKLDNGWIDNLYIDTNAVLTFVECKLYSNSGIKRDVYSQAMNYAADIRGMLAHYNDQEFLDRFAGIISTSLDPAFSSIDSVLEALSNDPVLGGKKKIQDWKRQFPKRLEQNIKNGICRIIIACAPVSQSYFASDNIMNLDGTDAVFAIHPGRLRFDFNGREGVR